MTAQGLWRWAGGKSRIIAPLFAHLDPAAAKYRRWVISFFGGGADAVEAMRRGLAKEYIFGDRLLDVMLAATLWRRVEKTLRRLIAYPEVVQKHYFYWIRGQETVPVETDQFPEWVDSAWPPTQEEWTALRLLYMQATCFNGIWRQNRKGKYNVPYARLGSIDWSALEHFEQLLATCPHHWHVGDFELAVALAAEGDFTYADPPYLETHDYGGVFGLADHVRLNQSLVAARSRGATPWASGSDTKVTRSIYTPRKIHVIEVPRSVGCKAASRGTKTELLMEF